MTLLKPSLVLYVLFSGNNHCVLPTLLFSITYTLKSHRSDVLNMIIFLKDFPPDPQPSTFPTLTQIPLLIVATKSH